MKHIYKLKNRKAFTLVEIVIVIAILGVLLAMVVPIALMSDKPSLGKSYAKDYFYKVQDFVSHKKLANDKTLTSGTTYVFLANVSPRKDIECGIITLNDAKIGAYISDSASESTTSKDFFFDFEQEMINNLSIGEYAGTCFAVVDSNYKVTASYWTDADDSTKWSNLMNSASSKIETDYICGSYYVLSFPVTLTTVPIDGSDRFLLS